MVAAPSFSPIGLPFLRPLVGAPWAGTPSERLPFPLALQTDSSLKNLDDVVDAISKLEASGELKELTTKHGGAVLIRGTHAKAPEDFSRIVSALKLGKPHEELGNPVVRNVLAPNVATANEGPNTQPVFPHSEFGWSAHYPSSIVFFCRKPAIEGGETPINSTAEVFARVRDELPEFIDELAEKGILYVYRYQQDVNPGSNNGNNIYRAYDRAGVLPSDNEATRRAKIEAQIKLHAKEWEWKEDGSLEVTHRLSVVRRDPHSRLPILFGNLCSFYLLAKKWDSFEPPYLGKDGAYHPPPLFGDGTPIPREYLEKLVEIIYDVRVLVKYELGDVLILDNHLVQHAREPWEGERKVLASLWDGAPALPYLEE
ncbi:hypothetical protein JCM8547_003672 [Rhodosporidiobolus lusitaniae]